MEAPVLGLAHVASAGLDELAHLGLGRLDHPGRELRRRGEDLGAARGADLGRGARLAIGVLVVLPRDLPEVLGGAHQLVARGARDAPGRDDQGQALVVVHRGEQGAVVDDLLEQLDGRAERFGVISVMGVRDRIAQAVSDCRAESAVDSPGPAPSKRVTSSAG